MNEKEYIERETLLDRIRGTGYAEPIKSNLLVMAVTIPAADVRPACHGHWVYEEPNGANCFKGAYWCDLCHQPESYRKNFCPNCGADMRGSNNEQAR